MKIRKYIPLLLIAFLFSQCLIVHAGTVHKWVDEKGVTHYSDTAPNDSYKNIEQFVVLDSYENLKENQEDYYSITNQWARMRDERLEREKLRLEEAKQNASQQAAGIPQIIFVNENENAYPDNFYYPAYIPSHRGIGFKHYKKRNHFTGKKRGSLHSNHYTRRTSMKSRLPRRGFSKHRDFGLTHTIR
jgi:hypothetical protein